MKQFYALKFTCLLLLVSAGLIAKAQKFRMVKDINASTDANPSNYQWPTTPAYAILNGVAYFSANDGINGGGLWRSDGTANGTTLIRSIAPDTTGTLIQNITPYKNTVIFSVTDQTRNQIWVSDGTSAGTKIVKDLPYKNYDPTQFTIINGLMYFVYSGHYDADQLWRTDGTDTGTVMVANLFDWPYNYAYGISNLTNYNDTAYFSVKNTTGGCLFKSDGTSAGTSAVFIRFDLNPQPARLTVVNNTLFFGASKNSSSGLWETDGTTAGTQLVAGSNGKIDLNQYSRQFQLPRIKNSLYFSFNNNLYSYDTKNVNDTVRLITIVNQASNFGYLNNIISINDSLLFFTIIDSAKTSQLWRTDGTATGTLLLKEISGINSSFFQNFYEFNKILFFSCYGDNLGSELWKSNGSVEGTKIVKDINPGIYSSNPSYCSAINTILLFQANDGTTGYELWKTDGTENGTSLVKDINKASTGGSYPTLYPSTGNYTVANKNQLIFEAFDDLHGTEIWKSDGTSSGTFLLKDVIPGHESGLSQLSLLANFKGSSYFFAQTITDTSSIWKTDGTSSGTILMQNFTDSINYSSRTGRLLPANMKGGDSLLFIEVFDPSYLYKKLYVTDGTFPVKLLKLDIPFRSILDKDLYLLGNTAFFLFTGENGEELWKSDGSVSGTVRVKNITPAANLSYVYFYAGIVYKNKFYFLPNNATANYLWVSDGTPGGTNVLKSIQVSPYTDFTISGNKLYFLADDGITGNELWVTDGTANGTQLVKDVNPGVNSSSFGSIVDVNGTVFFTADDGIHGNELWKSDGTAAGTVMVKDISGGSASTNIQNMVSAGTSLYFLVDGILWTSDGTETGTVTVNDTGLQGLRIINGLTAAADKLYFSAYTYKYGQELYVADANSTLPVTLLSFNGQWAKKDAQLAWVTTNELKNSHFNIQRSVTGMNFTTIGQVEAKGSAATKNNYSYTDVNAAELGGKNVYYRLQQVDLDGKVNYSNIVQLNTAASNNITIAPNPAQKTAFIISNTNISGALITLTDMGGHVVYSGKQNLLAGSPSPVDVSGLAAGMYNITIQNGADNKQQFKLIVK